MSLGRFLLLSDLIDAGGHVRCRIELLHLAYRRVERYPKFLLDKRKKFNEAKGINSFTGEEGGGRSHRGRVLTRAERLADKIEDPICCWGR